MSITGRVCRLRGMDWLVLKIISCSCEELGVSLVIMRSGRWLHFKAREKWTLGWTEPDVNASLRARSKLPRSKAWLTLENQTKKNKNAMAPFVPELAIAPNVYHPWLILCNQNIKSQPTC